MSIHKAIWHQQVGPVKTMESERVMSLDDEMVADLLAWCKQTTYAKDTEDTDWVFASSRMKGKQPLWLAGVMKNHIRSAAERAGITKHITWRCFRHTFSTLLVGSGEDIKTAQSLLRHANPNITHGIYAHAIDQNKRKRGFDLSITHKLSTESGSEFDVYQTRQASPHDHVSGWRVVGPGQIAAELRDLGQICGECLVARPSEAVSH